MRYNIVEANLEHDDNKILAINERNLVKQPKEWYFWKYRNCPNGPAHCWLAREDASNEPVGIVVLFPRKMLVNGKNINTSVAGDFAVDKKHRVFGPAVALQKIILKSVNDGIYKFIYSVPNDLSQPLLIKLGFNTAGTIKKYVKVLKTEYKTNMYLSPAGLTRLFSPLLDIVLRIISGENIPQKTSHYTFEIPERFDERFDALWKNISKQYGIIGERTARFLNWRYKESTAHDYKIFTITKNKGDLLGYIVYYIEENMCHIVDILAGDEENILNIIFKEFIRFLRKNKVGSISIYYFGNSKLERIIKRFNFFQRKKEDLKLLIYTNAMYSNSYLSEKDNWYFLIGDNDV